MSPEIERIFLAVVELDAAARSSYYEAHAVEEAVRREVDSLLAFDNGSSQFVAEGLLASLHRKMHEDDMAGHYGAYRIVKPIGGGGMGTVYLGERVDGEVVQQVAIKLLRNGSRNPERVVRFLRERQILATLQHPNIARLIDAGHREDGQPYLVMDYVDGKPVDEFAVGLGLRQKIDLVLEICGAVSYAHRNLVIHRDLKPSNILVDTSGHVHLLDFGIAKILDEADGGSTTGQRMLTPDYTSPEQIADRPITTATDVYSLGGVLYRLLTGHGPHEFEASTTPEGMLAAIQTREPARPSSLKPELGRDLDLILTKALRKDPEERYHTVDEMAADLRAYLESRPISARRGEWVYRSRKFLRRYWVPATAAAIAIAGLIAGFVVANRERAIAQRRFQEVRQLSGKLFEIDGEISQLPGSTKARQMIVETSLGYLSRLANEVHGDPELALELGVAYLRVGRVQGVPVTLNLGQEDKAEASLRTAEDLVNSVLEAQPRNRTAMLRAAQIAHDRMVLAQARRPDTESLTFARLSEKWWRKYVSSGPVKPADAQHVVMTGMNVANGYVIKGLYADGVAMLRPTIEIALATNQTRQAGAAEIVTVRALRKVGDLDGALAAARKAVALQTPSADEHNAGPLRILGLAIRTEGEVLGEDDRVSLGRPREAAARFEHALAIVAKVVRQDPNDAVNRFAAVANATRLAEVLRHSDPARAIAVYDQALRYAAEIRNNPRARRDEIVALAGSSHPLRKLKRLVEARERLDAAFSKLKELRLYPSNEPGTEAVLSLKALAELEADLGNVPKGLEVYQDLERKFTAMKPDIQNDIEDALDLSNLYRDMAAMHQRLGHAGAVLERNQRCLEIWRSWSNKLPGNSFVSSQLDAARSR